MAHDRHSTMLAGAPSQSFIAQLQYTQYGNISQVAILFNSADDYRPEYRW